VITARLPLAGVPGALEDLLQRKVHGKLIALPGAP
jgi:hypothetical protein